MVPSWALVGMCLRLTGPKTSFALIHIWTSWNIQMDTPDLNHQSKIRHWNHPGLSNEIYHREMYYFSLGSLCNTRISSIWWKQLWREVNNNPHWHLPQHHLLDWTICCTQNHTFVVVRTMNALITTLWPHRLMFFQNKSVLNKVMCLHRKNLVLWMVV